MATHSWTTGTGYWTDASNWSGGTVPQPGDVLTISQGNVVVPDGLVLDGYAVSLGSTDPSAPAVMSGLGAELGYFVTINSDGPTRFGGLVSWGINAYNGHVQLTSPGGTFYLSAGDNGSTPGNLILLNGANIIASNGDSVSQWGTLSNHGVIEIGNRGTLSVNGTIIERDGFLAIEAGGAVTGSGEIGLGLSSGLFLLPGSYPTTQNVRFTDVGAWLEITPSSFNGQIYNFQPGDYLTLYGVTGNSATYNASVGLLTVSYNGMVVASLHMQAPPGSIMATALDGYGDTQVQIVGTQPLFNYGLTADDKAMRADLARATFTTLDGMPINGAGIKIGIISDSFDARPGFGPNDPANAAALAGYLPLDPTTGTCAVTVLGDLRGDDFSDEGRAMAELIYKTAPGAQLYFNTFGGDLISFAAAVTSLQQAGCQIIVDDALSPGEPFFQEAGPLDAAIQSAVAAGVSYFSESGNQDGASYEGPYNPQLVTLSDGWRGQANIFSDGTPYQTITLLGGVTTTLVLQYAAPLASNGVNPPSALSATLYDMNGNPVAWSSRLDNVPGIGNEPGCYIQITPPALTQYRLAVQGLLSPGTQFKYVLFGSDGGSGPGGFIHDPAASNSGSVVGHDMLAGVNVIGAVDFATTPVFGSPATYTEYYSGVGPATFLFDANGNPLPSPLVVSKPDLVVPVNGSTDVPGFAPFGGTSPAAANAAAVAALVLQRDPSLTPAQVSNILKLSAGNLGLPVNEQGAGLIDAYGAVQLACFAAGTRIDTARGDVPVEALRAGDMARVADGGVQLIVWIGQRSVDCRRHPEPQKVRPVRIRPGAFGQGKPCRELWLSPDHAVFVDNVLIPVKYLVEDDAIVQVAVDAITYYHIELPRHDVLLAEGLPVESYLDVGDRMNFGHSGAVVALHPDFASRAWEAEGYAPLIVCGPKLEAVKRAIAARKSRQTNNTNKHPALKARAAATAVVACTA